MHFSIPDTQDIKVGGSSYKAFNMHVNGVLHCTVRYSQLHNLNEQLKEEVGETSLPPFPPKHFLPLKGGHLEDRKLQLEKYIQEVSQEPAVSNSETFNNFLRKAQQETRREETFATTLEISLLNGSKVTLDINSTDKTDYVLEKVMETMGLPDELVYYFGLFLIRKESKNDFFIVRKLQDFESPYISLKCLRERPLYKIVIRKAYWNQSLDDLVMKDRIGLNLLHVQAESDVLMGWSQCKKEAKQRIASLSKRGSKLECVQFCQTLENYGYIRFKPCVADFPEKDSKIVVYVGNYEVKFRVLVDGKATKEYNFAVTRIKCWKVCSHADQSADSTDHPLLQLSFEYLVGKGELRWICLISDQVIMMSMSIKSMVNELVRKRTGERIKKPTTQAVTGSKATFKARDKLTEVLFDPSEILKSDGELSLQKAKESVKKFSEKLSGVSIVSSSPAAHHPPSSTVDGPLLNPPTNRTTFEDIMDDDL